MSEKILTTTNGCTVVYVTISPDLRHIAAITQDGYLHLYSDQKIVKKLQLVGKKITESNLEQFLFEFSPDSKSLGLPGDLMFRYLECPEFKYTPTTLACSKNISIVRWPLEKIVIVACIDYSIKVLDLNDEKITMTFTASSNPWDFIYTNESIIVAVTNKEEIIKNVKLVKQIEPLEEEEVDHGEKEEKNLEKQLFDRTLGIYPQEPIVPEDAEKSPVVLFRSCLGTIQSLEYYSGTKRIAKIEIEFDDSSFHANINFPNTHDFTLAYMSENGALLASQSSEVNLDEFVSDSKKSSLYFRNFTFDSFWKTNLPNMEIPESICVSSLCIVFTSLNYMRFFTLGGIQTMIISMPGPVVTMAGYKNQIAIIYHAAAPVLGCQALCGEFWFINEMNPNSEAEYFKEDFKVSVTPEHNLVWMGFSDNGDLYSVDSADVVRAFWRRALSWIPVCTLSDYVRIVGVCDDGVLVNAGRDHLIIETQAFEFPLCKSKYVEYESSMMKEQLYVEMHSGTVDKKKKLAELDKVTIEKFYNAVDEGENDQAFAYGCQVLLNKTKLLIIRYAQELKVFSIADRIAKHFNIQLPPRFTRPEKPPAPSSEDPKPQEPKQPLAELPKENKETQEPLKNPFNKAGNTKKDLFESLSSNTKRKIENPPVATKKPKK